MKHPLAIRLLAIAAVAIAVLFPIRLIAGKVLERQGRAEAVSTRFAAETSGPQAVVGPLLALTCEETVEKAKLPCPTEFFAPAEFRVAAEVPVEPRHRGIYPIRLFRAQASLSGAFRWPAPPPPNGPNARAWKEAHVVLYVQDPRGIKAISAGALATPSTGPSASGLEPFAVRFPLGRHAAHEPGSEVAFDVRLSLVGTSSLGFAPVGERNEIRLASAWPHPSFGDSWSPDERGIGPGGFEATWRIASIATGGAGTWTRAAQARQLASVRLASVALVEPVNVYQLAYRATEYAFLFVLFTFAALALAEVVAGVRLHPVQYALVGSALAVFFLLLLALSEHLAFRTSYALAATACVLLVTFYLRHPLGSAARAGLFLGLLASLYGTLYVLLRSEDHALLMGSLLIFLVLAVAMVATRKVDWAEVSARWARPAASAPPSPA